MTENPDNICPLCQGVSFRIVPFRYAFNDKFLNAMKCRQCGLTSIFPRPTAEEISAMYSDEYFTVADKRTHHGTTDYISDIQKLDYTQNVVSLKKTVSGGNFLEIGCATGSLLNAMKKEGFKYISVGR